MTPTPESLTQRPEISEVLRELWRTLKPKPRPLNPYRARELFTGTTVVEIAVLSGKLIATDDLRRVPYFDIDPVNSVNYGLGQDEWAKLFAERAQVAHASVGNTCPRITGRDDGSLVVVSPDFDEEGDEAVLLDGESLVASIITDLWAVQLVDYDNWMSHGGFEPTPDNGLSVIEVTPGLYQWTVYSHSDEFDRDADGRVEFAKLELIQAC